MPGKVYSHSVSPKFYYCSVQWTNMLKQFCVSYSMPQIRPTAYTERVIFIISSIQTFHCQFTLLTVGSLRTSLEPRGRDVLCITLLSLPARFRHWKWTRIILKYTLKSWQTLPMNRMKTGTWHELNPTALTVVLTAVKCHPAHDPNTCTHCSRWIMRDSVQLSVHSLCIVLKSAV